MLSALTKNTQTQKNDNRGKRKLREAMNVSTVLEVVMLSQVYPKVIELYTLNMYSLLHVSHTSKERLENNKRFLNFLKKRILAMLLSQLMTQHGWVLSLCSVFLPPRSLLLLTGCVKICIVFTQE